ncbi:MAG: hypothetical protein A3E85_05915 [Gammaproteobacteria bacterium RIFCSPHIGHO2_12_FULL_45_12]|nr:MAG: hypothetical protein A3E85_05915 [Gammaproteobacteria bacterium RIFCSPHIGHO2_12_FULL_45_12]
MFFFKIVIGCLFVMFMQACSREPTIPHGHLSVVTRRAYTNTLFYTGIVQPVTTQVIVSPADGVIMAMPFQFGEAVKSGQLLFVLSSSKFISDYKAALMQYIKAKNEFNMGKTQLSEATFLHQNQLISDDDYKSRQTNYYAGQLSLLQAKDALSGFLHPLKIKEKALFDLTIADVDKIAQALHLNNEAENLQVMSFSAGVLLSPDKMEGEVKRIGKGDMVKQGDVLAVLGDMSGLSIKIKANELRVNQLKAGQKVKVTGIAFAEHVLYGKVKRVDQQGESGNGGMPTFTVEVVVSRLSAAEQRDVHPGMSAKVEIDVDEAAAMMVPLAAVSETGNEASVQRFDPVSGKVIRVAIKTGKTTVNDVAILSGLKEGDKIVIPD